MAFSEKYLKRFASFEKALKKFQDFLSLNLELEILIEVASKRFEYTFETMWKVLKLYLMEVKGIECISAMDCIKAAIKMSLFPSNLNRLLLRW